LYSGLYEKGIYHTRTPGRARGAKSKLAPDANEITPARGAGAASAITPGNDDGQVNDVGGEVGCQVSSVVVSNVGSSSPLYWDSPEAAKLFGFSYQDGHDVHKGVQDIVTSLTRVQQSHDGYKHFVKVLLIMTQHHFYLIHPYSLYLFSCLQLFPFMLSFPQLRRKSLIIGSSAVPDAQPTLNLSHLISCIWLGM
jgi:hypothetical protein